MKVSLEQMAQPFLIRIIEEDKDVIASKLGAIWSAKKDAITLEGFRKGKVPQNIAENKFGFQALYKDYIDEVITTAIAKINTDNSVTVVDLQQVVPEKLDKEGIVMQAVAYLKPVVLSLDYNNIPVTKPDADVSDQELTTQMNEYREQNALVVPITDRGVQYGDLLVVSYIGSIGGVPFQGGTATRQQIQLNEGSFIPGFGEQILGMNAGETKTFSVTFPEQYQATQLAGKESSFDITVHEVKVKKLPDLDDDLAITCGFTTLDDMKQKVSEGLSARKAQYAQSKTETEICLELVRRATIAPLPATMVQKRLMGILQQEASQSGMSEKDYLKARNVDQNAFDRAYYQLAVRDLKIQLVLDYVASAEALTVSEDERNAYVTSEADRLGYTVDQVKGMTSQDQLDSQVKLRKAYDLLLTKVTHTESTNGTGA